MFVPVIIREMKRSSALRVTRTISRACWKCGSSGLVAGRPQDLQVEIGVGEVLPGQLVVQRGNVVRRGRIFDEDEPDPSKPAPRAKTNRLQLVSSSSRTLCLLRGDRRKRDDRGEQPATPRVTASASLRSGRYEQHWWWRSTAMPSKKPTRLSSCSYPRSTPSSEARRRGAPSKLGVGAGPSWLRRQELREVRRWLPRPQ